MFNWFKKNKKELVTDVLPSSIEDYTMKYMVNGEEMTLPFKTRIVNKKYIYNGKEEYIAEYKIKNFPWWTIRDDDISYLSHHLSEEGCEELKSTDATKEEAQKRIDIYIKNYLDKQYTTTCEDYP